METLSDPTLKKRNTAIVPSVSGRLSDAINVRRFSVQMKIDKAFYNRMVSLDQIIEREKRTRRLSKKLSLKIPESNEDKSQTVVPFSEEFYENIESFLDQLEVFIVSPRPVRAPKLFRSYLRKKTNNLSGNTSPRNCEVESAVDKKPLVSEKQPEESELVFSKAQSVPVSKLTVIQSPFLGRVNTSSLLQRRKKFESLDDSVHFNPIAEDEKYFKFERVDPK